MGTNVTVSSSSGDASITFSQVTVMGNTTFTPIIPPSSALHNVSLPPGPSYSILNDAPAYSISTTAVNDSRNTVCFTVSSINDAETFERLRILQIENSRGLDRT